MPNKPITDTQLKLRRQNAPIHVYGKRWQRERKAFLNLNPLCVYCLRRGKTAPATVVDHIVPHRNDMLIFWDSVNWQALCKPCHDRKTGNQNDISRKPL